MRPIEPAISSADLLTQTARRVEWLVEQRLPRNGGSVLAGTPGVGKRNLARDLALAVSRGRPWLGFPVHGGSVLYAKLFDFSKLRAPFAQGGLEPSDRIYFVNAEEPGGRVERIRDYVRALEPTLIIVDGLEQLRQEAALYRRTTDEQMINRVLELGETCGAHVLMIHDIVDSLAGDLASFIGGTSRTLDSILMVSGKDGQRVLRTVQRQGLDLLEGIPLPEVDAEREAAVEDLETQIFAFLRRSGHLADRDEIVANVSWGDEAETRSVVKAMHRRGELIRTGSGTHADPYRYTGFDRVDDPTRPLWLRKVRPWARVGRGTTAHRARAS